jgi:hypothetical protein
MYKKVLLAYDGSIEGRLALREGAKLAQLCHSDVFLLAVVEFSSSSVAMEGGFVAPVEDQISDYKNILAEGVGRLKAMGFSPTARLGTGPDAVLARPLSLPSYPVATGRPLPGHQRPRARVRVRKRVNGPELLRRVFAV